MTDEDISGIKNEYKNIPEDYIEYLRFIGWGNFRECQFVVYKFPGLLADVYIESEINEINNYVFFGDNFSGDFSGFDMKNGKVVEWWHETDEIYETGKTFKEYIREQMLMDENGNDTRANKIC